MVQIIKLKQRALFIIFNDFHKKTALTLLGYIECSLGYIKCSLVIVALSVLHTLLYNSFGCSDLLDKNMIFLQTATWIIL